MRSLILYSAVGFFIIKLQEKEQNINITIIKIFNAIIIQESIIVYDI